MQMPPTFAASQARSGQLQNPSRLPFGTTSLPSLAKWQAAIKACQRSLYIATYSPSFCTAEVPCACRSNLQDLNNVLGALYLVMVFLGIINATSVQPVAYTERSVSLLPSVLYTLLGIKPHAGTASRAPFSPPSTASQSDQCPLLQPS